MPDEPIEKAVSELNQGLYGPKFCKHCNKIQPVKTYKLQGSDTYETENTGESIRVRVGFTGAYVCTECFRPITDT